MGWFEDFSWSLRNKLFLYIDIIFFRMFIALLD